MASFANKVVIVTGSSSGIGKATAILFASRGAKVTITGRDIEALKDTKEQCLKAGAKAEDILDIRGDITVKTIQDRLIGETIKKFGKLDILINNHGGGFKETDDKGNLNVDLFDQVMDLNCKSTLAMSVKSLPHLKATKGCIVNISSIASFLPSAPSTLYALAKASLDHLTRMLAMQNAKDGVRVNCINPGLIRTSFLKKVGISGETQDRMEEVAGRVAIPCGRVGMPEEIAKPILFLADNDAASYITGQTITADGGLSLTNAGFCNPEWSTLRQPPKTN